MPEWSFEFERVFDADDRLSVWMATLAIAFNDLVQSNLDVDRSKTPWDRLYRWRIATAHYNEASLHLERGGQIEEVSGWLDAQPDLHVRYREALRRYEGLRALTNRVRNEAAFHYAHRSGERAVGDALRELCRERGRMGGKASNKIKDSRQFYADDVVAHLVWAAAGGSEQAYAEFAEALAFGVAAFARFANNALEVFFFERRTALRVERVSRIRRIQRFLRRCSAAS
jgi:hypothetical protein